MLFSIIIPAYNESEILPQTLREIQSSVSSITPLPDFEIIVCDNNSTDQTAEIAQELGAKTIFEPINQISKARNTGAGIAQGEWFLFIDADTFPPPELMEEINSLIQKAQIVGCGTTIEVVGGTKFNKLRMERLNPLMRWFKWSGGAFLLDPC